MFTDIRISPSRPALLIAGCLLLPSAFFGQSAWTVFDASSSGLPFDAVNCIAFEAGGLKWIGTEGGLAAFDDTTWTVYTKANSGLPGNEVRSLLVDANNVKWIGTFLDGLARFDGSTWTVYNTSNSALPDNQIKALAVDTAGVKWIGTVAGLVRYDDTTFTVYDLSNSPFEITDNITDIHIDSNNVFTVGTLNGGLIRIVDTAWTVFTIPNGSGIPDNTQLEVAVDSNGVEWLATPSNGLVAHPGPQIWFAYTPFTSTMPSYGATSLELMSNPDRIWVGTIDKGIVRKTGATFVSFDPANSPFPDSHVNCVEHDTAGRLWIGTSMKGLVRLDESLLTGIDVIAGDAMWVYPNPAGHALHVEGATAAHPPVLADLAGHVIDVQAARTDDGWVLNLSAVRPGMYLLRLRAGNGRRSTVKIIRSDSMQ